LPEPDWTLSQCFDYGGQSVAWDAFGDGPAVVLVHGTPFSSHVWRRIGRELARHCRVHVYDLLGYGQSEKRAGQDVSLGVQNGVFAALLDHWRLTAPYVVAHDFGGATVLRAHILNGCDYARLLLIDPVAIRPWGSPFVQHVRQHEAAFAGMPDYLHRAILAAYIRGAVSRHMTDAELEPYIRRWIGDAGQPAFYRQIAQMDLKFTDEVEHRYAEIRCPVLLLWGTEDQWIPVARGREFASRIPACEIREIAGSGHLMQEDAPEAIVAAALKFFDGADSCAKLGT
jgi:pimeloyl-ACP methyl ester carboxylesterase